VASDAGIKKKKRNNQEQEVPKSFPPFAWRYATKDGPPEIQVQLQIKFAAEAGATCLGCVW
jgi:hypothetical protein